MCSIATVSTAGENEEAPPPAAAATGATKVELALSAPPADANADARVSPWFARGGPSGFSACANEPPLLGAEGGGDKINSVWLSAPARLLLCWRVGVEITPRSGGWCGCWSEHSTSALARLWPASPPPRDVETAVERAAAAGEPGITKEVGQHLHFKLIRMRVRKLRDVWERKMVNHTRETHAYASCRHQWGPSSSVVGEAWAKGNPNSTVAHFVALPRPSARWVCRSFRQLCEKGNASFGTIRAAISFFPFSSASSVSVGTSAVFLSFKNYNQRS